MKKQTPQLPRPGDDAIEHSQKLVQAIVAEITKNDGQISFERYMSMALFQPGQGYYVSGSQKFGASGDFVTAPEISPLFSYSLARQCVEVFTLMDTTEEKSILEFGAGSGIMAADIMVEMNKLGCLPDHYFILEVSADLRQRQQSTLKAKAGHLVDRVVWLEELPVEGFCGVVLANEVLDAMPVHRFYKEGQTLGEYYVAWEDSHFVWRRDAVSNTELEARLSELAPDLPDSYTSEVNLAASAWVSSITNWMKNGVVFIIDYGFPQHEYYHWQREQGTLMCHYRHHSHEDPFLYPGLQDITTHVDFTAVARAADAAGLHIIGYTNQAFFLLGNKVETYMQNMDSSSPEYIKYAQQLKTLMMPGEMGELFKVMALGKSFSQSLQGFAAKDDRHRL